jgi:hypothetical protein
MTEEEALKNWIADHKEELSRVDTLAADGHTRHCACRIVWGDGECTCRIGGIMQEKIAKLIETENAYGYYAHDRAEELADQILSLINAERCVWTKDEDGDWDTACGRCYDHDEVNTPAGYCNGCGKQIEVKDANS